MNLKSHFTLPYLAVAVVTALLCLMAYPLLAEDAQSRVDEVQSRMGKLAHRATYLTDRQKIWDASKRYTRGADRHDKDLVRSAFWPDATISHGEPMSRDEFISQWLKELAGYAAHQHHITGQTVDIDGNTAHVESYVIYFLVPRDTSADKFGPASPGKPLLSRKTYLGSGRYIERWEQREGEWKVVVHEYVEDLALLGETIEYCTSEKCLGTWNKSDLSYVRPLKHLTPEERRIHVQNNPRRTSPLVKETSSESDGD